MNKVDLVKNVVNRLAAEDVKVSQRAMGQYVDTIIDVIKDALVSGEEVSITGFGKFEVVERSARIGVNPQNPSIKVEIPESRAPKFKASLKLKSLIKGE